jgi:hypothetical protein
MNVQRRSLLMPATVHDATDQHLAVDKRSSIGEWEVHSWGNSRLPGMAALSAIATLQLGATLAEDPADSITLNRAAEYLTSALAQQLKAFQQKLAAR